MKIYKQLVTLLIVVCVSTPLFSSQDLDVSLSLAKAKKTDEVIDRVNSVNRYINQYILETADKTPTKDELINYFTISKDLFKSYSKGSDFSFVVSDTNVTYSSLIPQTLTDKEKSFFKYSHNLHPQAVVTNSYAIEIALDAKVQLFITKHTTLPASQISLTKLSDTTKLWYKPDGVGGFYTYYYDGSSWKLKTSDNKQVTSTVEKKDTIMVKSKADLQSLVASSGDVAYVEDNTSVSKYIYSGTAWLKQSGASSSSSSDSCEASDVGVMRYSKSEDCMQRCVVKDNNASWSCIESGGGVAKNTDSGVSDYFEYGAMFANSAYIAIDISKDNFSTSMTQSVTFIMNSINGDHTFVGNSSSYLFDIYNGNTFYDARVFDTDITFNRVFKAVNLNQTLKAGNKYTVTVVYKSGNSKIYINGKLAGSSNTTWTSNLLYDITKIGLSHSDYKPDSKIFDVQFYNKALTQEEVTKVSKGQTVDSLVAHYEFNNTNSLGKDSLDKYNGVNNGATPLPQ